MLRRWPLILTVVLLVGAYFGKDILLASAISSYASRTLQADVDLSLSLSPFSGRGQVHSFSIKNPDGFSDGEVLYLETGTFQVNIRSFFTGEVIVEDISLEGLQINLLGTPQNTNVTQLYNNARQTSFGRKIRSGGGGGSGDSRGKRVMIQNFALRDIAASAKMDGMEEIGAHIDLPDIHMQNINDGKGHPAWQVAEQVALSLYKQLNDEALKGVLGGAYDNFRGQIDRGVQKLHNLKDNLKYLGDDAKKFLGR